MPCALHTHTYTHTRARARENIYIKICSIRNFFELLDANLVKHSWKKIDL